VIWISKNWYGSFPLLESSCFQTTWPTAAFISVAVNPLKAGFKRGAFLPGTVSGSLVGISHVSSRHMMVRSARCGSLVYIAAAAANNFINCFDHERIKQPREISHLPELW
jgi:hypothetical protein